tara:strand:- start:203 stop:394 length:192 start_codon:yes stop_codon:yes gene_type:complete
VEKIAKEIIEAKKRGDKLAVQKLQQELDHLEQISKKLDWDRYYKLLRSLEDRPDKEDFPKDDK